ncbi:hypothetical protein Aab01nite_80540 [Paractinoplanes abujensis]|nr:hypothetical protein Aab01nite_80540 [Actinoplanes abujensis]
MPQEVVRAAALPEGPGEELESLPGALQAAAVSRPAQASTARTGRFIWSANTFYLLGWVNPGREVWPGCVTSTKPHGKVAVKRFYRSTFFPYGGESAYE